MTVPEEVLLLLALPFIGIALGAAIAAFFL
jgi:hypothetical protein